MIVFRMPTRSHCRSLFLFGLDKLPARTKGFEVSMSPFKFLPSHKRKSNYRVTVLPSNSIAFGRNIPLAPHSCIFKIKESLIIK